MNKSVSLITFGCKMNQAESQKIGETLNLNNFNVYYDNRTEEHNYYLINTCTVTSESERKIRQLIRKIKKKYSNSKVITVGCYSHSDANVLIETGADLVLGNLEKKSIMNYIEKKGIFVDNLYWLDENDKILIPNNSYSNRTRVFFPIQEGCINSCSFCKVVFARGTKLRSLDSNLIVDQIDNYYNKGYKEIVLTGINLGYYGYENNIDLINLLHKIEKQHGNKNLRIRLTSLYPDFINEKFTEVFINSKIYEKHIHLSLQHLSDRVLKSMGRKYNFIKIKEVFELIRKHDSLFSFTADIIVGYPNETHEDYLFLKNNLFNLELLKTHLFRYSKRPGTKSYKSKEEVSNKIKKERLNELSIIEKKIRERYLYKLKNKTTKVLIEDLANSKYSTGYDEYYIFHKVHDLINENNVFINAKILDINEEGVSSIVL